MFKKLNDLLDFCNKYLEQVAKLPPKTTSTTLKALKSTDDNPIQILADAIELYLSNKNPDTLPDTPIAYGILNDNFSTEIDHNGETIAVKLNKESGVQIYKEEKDAYKIKVNYKNYGVIELSIPKTIVLLSPDNLEEIQATKDTDIIFFANPTPNKTINITNFIAGYSTSISSKFRIDLTGIDLCLHKGLQFISKQLYKEEAYAILLEGSKQLKDKPLDPNSSITGSINFSSITVNDWLNIYKWTDEEVSLYADKEIAFRFTCYKFNKKPTIFVEQLGVVDRTSLPKKVLDELKNTIESTEFITEEWKGYQPLSEEQQTVILEALTVVPTDYLYLLDDIRMVFDDKIIKEEGKSGALAFVKRDGEDLVFSFTENMFKMDSDIVLGDKGDDDKNTLLESTIIHEMGHLIGKQAFHRLSNKVNTLIDEVNTTEPDFVDLTAFYNEQLFDPYFDPKKRKDATKPERVKYLCNTYVLDSSDQIPPEATTIEEIANFLSSEEMREKYYNTNEIGVIIQTKSNKFLSDREKASNALDILSTEGVVEPSGRHRILKDKIEWEIQKTYKKTAFMEVLKKDGDRLTAYSNTSGEEAFAEGFSLFVTQPETTKALSPNIYNYFNDRVYENHDLCPSLKDF